VRTERILKPRLLILSGLYPNAENPVRGTFVRLQAEALAKDYAVRVIAWDFPSRAAIRNWKDSGVSVEHIHFPSCKRFFPASIPAFRLFALPRIKQALTQWKPDIVHVHDFAHLPGLYVLKGLLDGYAIPRFLTLHNLKSLPGLLNHSATNFIYSITLRKALSDWTRIFTVNPALAAEAGKYGSPVQCIGNGIPQAERKDFPALANIRGWLGSGAFKILAVGNLIPSKGFDLLISSVKALKDSGLQVRTLIVGEGTQRGSLQDLVAKLGLNSEIWIYGALPHAEVRSLYYEFDVFTLPSHSESFGIVYLEAAWAGIPSIGVRGQGIWGILKEDEEALFMEPNDQNGLTALLLRLAVNPAERHRLGDNAQKRCAQDFLLESVLHKVKDSYREASATGGESG
jgi:glycosyltransferase involved in cell wall biosynthesis